MLNREFIDSSDDVEKIMAEQNEITVLDESMIYTSINKLVHKEHCSFTAGYQTYDFIYITDAINSIIAVAEKGTLHWLTMHGQIRSTFHCGY